MLPVNEFYENQIVLYQLGGMPELQQLKSIIGRQKGSVAIDVGANIGEISYYLLQYCGVRRVEAFEPNPEVFETLAQLPYPNLISHKVALSDSEGYGILTTPTHADGENLNTGLSSLHPDWIENMRLQFPLSVGSGVVTHQVELKTLDSYNFEDVKVIKVDAEGHELYVLKGAEQTINRWKPVLVIEAFGNLSIFDVVVKYGYKCFYYDTNAKMLREAHTIIDLPSNIVNLIFVPR